jgi:hypothetical protein
MKKILASIVALTAVTGFAGIAHAGGNSSSTAVGTASTGVTSVHGGTVAVQCTISAVDGTLAQNAANLNIIDSSSAPGTITTKCNTTTSKLSTELTSSSEPAAANPAANAYTVGYKLKGGSKAYNFGALNAGIPTVANNTYTTGLNSTIVVNDIGYGLLDQFSTVNVIAQGKVNPNAQLVAGAYEIIVTNTVTP